MSLANFLHALNFFRRLNALISHVAFSTYEFISVSMFGDKFFLRNHTQIRPEKAWKIAHFGQKKMYPYFFNLDSLQW